MASLRAIQTETARAQGELHRVGTLIENVSRFRLERGGITLLFSGLARALPDSTAMLSFRVDSVEGSFVALSPHTADIVPRLIDLNRVASPRIVGSITTEAIAGARLERATVRFRRAIARGVGSQRRPDSLVHRRARAQ
jgi:hypothetical protein